MLGLTPLFLVFALFSWWILCGSPQAAQASYTPVMPSRDEPDLIGDWNLLPPDDPNHEGILGYLYGWDNLTRVEDDGNPASDQWWRPTDPAGSTARAVAAYAGNVFDLGWLDDSDSFHPILQEIAATNDYIDFLSEPYFPDDPFRFGLHSGWPDYSSRPSDNGGEDHMITFLISGNSSYYGRDYSDNPVGQYVIAWEDVPLQGADGDYNDLVLELYGVAPGLPVDVVPEPATALLLSGGLLLLLAGKRLADVRSRRA